MVSVPMFRGRRRSSGRGLLAVQPPDAAASPRIFYWKRHLFVICVKDFIALYKITQENQDYSYKSGHQLSWLSQLLQDDTRIVPHVRPRPLPRIFQFFIH
jgi:hypothetical protein